jgi:hypothetical protein
MDDMLERGEVGIRGGRVLQGINAAATSSGEHPTQLATVEWGKNTEEPSTPSTEIDGSELSVSLSASTAKATKGFETSEESILESDGSELSSQSSQSPKKPNKGKQVTLVDETNED